MGPRTRARACKWIRSSDVGARTSQSAKDARKGALALASQAAATRFTTPERPFTDPIGCCELQSHGVKGVTCSEKRKIAPLSLCLRGKTPLAFDVLFYLR